MCVCVFGRGGGVGGRLHLQVHGIGFGLRALVRLGTRTKGRGANFAAANPHHLLLRVHSRQLSVEGGVSVDKGAAAAIGGGPGGGVGVGIAGRAGRMATHLEGAPTLLS